MLNKVCLLVFLAISVVGYSQDLDTAAAEIDTSLHAPEYIGGEEAFYEFLEHQLFLNYAGPSNLSLLGEQVAFRFAIDKFGGVKNITLLNTSNNILANTMLDALRDMPLWTPGTYAGKKKTIFVEYHLLVKMDETGHQFMIEENNYRYEYDKSTKDLKYMLIGAASALMLFLFLK